jgi:serine/threonine protein kinase
MQTQSSSILPAPVDQIFVEALTLGDPAARAALVAKACGNDTLLQRRVEALLAAHEAAGSFLNLPAADSGLDSSILNEGPGAKVGRYKLLEPIGEGGFAVVFMAEQSEPVRRKVALKIIKAGMDTKQVVARFGAERQALAMMDHSSIAKVFDAGATEAGRPYFVMELVKGVPITQYCDEQNFGIDDRLKLFAQVCQAVQYAHQKGVIHRDLKPSNILVSTQDHRPLAKVIDFGIAKATQTPLTDKTLFTDFRQLVGTPAYMSPEQADGSLDIDTRSDLYSLGVLLYELLAGTPPFDPKELRSKSFAEMQRIIREVEPPTPSSRISTLIGTQTTVAAHRAVDARKLAATLRGDLDWIVMRCLEKDRSRRYQSAEALADDLARYQSNQPVEARRPTRLYRLKKFIRRNKGTALAGLAIAAVLTLGTVVSTWQAVRATRAEHEALDSAAAERAAKEAETAARLQAEEVSNYLSSALSSPDPWADGRKVTIAEVLDRDVRDLQGKFAEDPRTKAALLRAIGRAYVGLGLFNDAVPLFEQALQLRKRDRTDERFDAVLMSDLAWVYNRVGRLDDAVALAEQALPLMKSAFGSSDPKAIWTAHHLALSYAKVGRSNDAIRLMTATVELGKTTVPPDESLEADLGTMYSESGQPEKGIPLLERALESAKRKYGPEHDATLWPMLHLAECFRRAGRLTDATPLEEQALARARKQFGPRHPCLIDFLAGRAQCYCSSGQSETAVPLLQEALEIGRSSLGETHPNTLWVKRLLEQTSSPNDGRARPLGGEAAKLQGIGQPTTTGK